MDDEQKIMLATGALLMSCCMLALICVTELYFLFI